jgi:hypothetical protein
MNNENREKWYPKNISEEEAKKLFKDAWTEDYYRRLGWHEGNGVYIWYGSALQATRHTINALPNIFSKYEIKSILDSPCGDFHWMKEVDLSAVKYIGVDLVEAQIERNLSLYPSFDFRVLILST